MIIKAIIKFINSTKNHQALPCFSSQINIPNQILPYKTNLEK